MSANGISTLASRQARQIAKLNLAQTQRQTPGPGYRGGNIYDITALPTQFSGNAIVDNPNPDGLLLGRPWTGIAAIAAPTTIQEAVPPQTLLVLESYYDASDGTYFVPANPADNATFTQWKDKSAFAHNANPTGGATTRPTVQTAELNAKSVVRFDGVNDGLTINPYTNLVNAPAITIFVLAKLTATAGYPKLFGQDQSLDMFYSTDSNSWRFNVTGAVATSTGANDSAWHIHTVAFDGSQGSNATKFRYRRDRAAVSLTYSGMIMNTIGPGNSLSIGNYNAASQFFTGDIAEFLIFTKALPDTEIANVENYLKTKWGL